MLSRYDSDMQYVIFLFNSSLGFDCSRTETTHLCKSNILHMAGVEDVARVIRSALVSQRGNKTTHGDKKERKQIACAEERGCTHQKRG